MYKPKASMINPTLFGVINDGIMFIIAAIGITPKDTIPTDAGSNINTN